MTKKSSWVLIILFLAFIYSFFIINIVKPDIKFSEQENRELTQLPEFSFESLFTGKYTSKYETYTTDQFAFRDSWTTMKAACELAIGKKENKGVYLCKEDILAEKYTAPKADTLKTNIDAVKSLSEKAGVPVYLALIPGLSQIRSDVLPKYAPTDSQLKVIDYCYKNSGAVNIDMASALSSHKDEYIFYRTDHHWTSRGAYYGYKTIMEAMGGSVPSLESYEPRQVSDSFYGTIYSKSGMRWVKPDTMDIFVPQEATTQVLNYSSGEAEAGTLYDYAFLEKKDKYSMFMGGITPLLKITTGAEAAPSLLILRDSFADSLVPFMQEDFSEIHVMDLRYYKTQLVDSTVADYIKANGIDRVLICYSAATFGSDANVFLMGE